MYKAAVKFASVEDAKTFAGICNEVDFKVELVAEPYVIDAKSLMGLFNLDFSQPIALRAYCQDDGSAFAEKIRPFLVAGDTDDEVPAHS